ncbi:hypothetical protein [Christiangramia sp.]|uniref:hypothetical protein n=1 Tax=Christiangramia sp. TaxID=1931228 RepID=UPI0026256FF0|nr:hypothetical protein [Christiangramia sp.]
MISLAKVKEWTLENGKRILKVLQYGPKTSKVSAPFGDDSNPIKDMTAILAETGVNGEPIILGYINKSQIAKVGEKRIFSLKENGELSSFIWLKNDETIEIGGNLDFAVRFNKLKEALDVRDQDINAELTKIATGITAAGGTYTPTPISTDISAAKNDKIKLS